MDIEVKAEAALSADTSGKSMSADEWTLVEWLKSVGDPVRSGEPIAEIMTEKVNVEVVSPADGVLHAQLVQVDDVGRPDTTLAIVRTP